MEFWSLAERFHLKLAAVEGAQDTAKVRFKLAGGSNRQPVNLLLTKQSAHSTHRKATLNSDPIRWTAFSSQKVIFIPL